MSNDTKELKIRVCGIEPESIVDGPGFRFALFVQGCPHHCPGCHNPESWAFDAGEDMSVDEIFAMVKENPNLRGVTLSGGEPFEQVPALIELSRLVKESGLTLMAYSGYTLEELESRRDPATDALLGMLDILVDGRFVEAERNLTLQYRGSENQRVIDMNKTREIRARRLSGGSGRPYGVKGGDSAGDIALYHSDFDEEILI